MLCYAMLCYAMLWCRAKYEFIECGLPKAACLVSGGGEGGRGGGGGEGGGGEGICGRNKDLT